MATTRKHEHLDAPILRLVRGMCREAEYNNRKRGRVSMAEICERARGDLGVELVSRAEAGPLKRLLDKGELVRFPVREGPALFQGAGACYTYRVPDLDSLNLEGLLELVRRNVDPELKLTPGRKSTSSIHASRQVFKVNPTQFEFIEQALRKLIEHLFPRSRPRRGDTREQGNVQFREGLRSVGADDLVWAEGAGAHGLGDWAILREMEAACKDLKRNTADRYVGSIRTMLDLAATHGFLLRRDVHGGERSFLPATWTAALEAWDRIVRESGHHHPSAGTAQLSRIMAAMAECFARSADYVDPTGLTEDQSIAFAQYLRAKLNADTVITTHQRSAVLSTLRALMDGGVLKRVDISEYDRRRIRGRKNAFDATAMKAIAREFASDTRRPTADYSLFAALGTGAFFDAQNTYSLPHLVDWYTLTSVRHREPKGLSAVNSFPRQKVRGGGGLSGRPWNEATLMHHLELLGMFLGYIVRYHGVDLTGEVDARNLFTKQYLVGFVDAVEEDDWTSKKRALDLIYHVSLYTSPCWESAALRNEDRAQADAFQALSDYAAGRGSKTERNGYNGLTLHVSQREEWGRSRNGANHEGQRRRAQQVQDAYERATGERYAYAAMLRIRNAAIDRFCRELGVADLVQFQLELGHGRSLSVTDFTSLRDIMIWSDGLAAPNRRKTVALLDMSDRHQRPNGELWARIPAKKMKVPGNGPYNLLLGHRGSSMALGYRFDLWDSYQLARSRLLDGRVTDVMYLSTTSSDADGRDPWRLVPDTVSGLYTKVLGYGAAELNVDISPILALDGLASSHAMRHAAGTFFVSKNHFELARRMLHHKGLDVLLAVYAGGDDSTSAESALADMGSVA